MMKGSYEKNARFKDIELKACLTNVTEILMSQLDPCNKVLLSETLCY